MLSDSIYFIKKTAEKQGFLGYTLYNKKEKKIRIGNKIFVDIRNL